jgi:hypothetical protein
MSGASPNNDEYADDLEMQGENLRAQRQELELAEQKWRTQVTGYAAFLRSRNRPIPVFAQSIENKSEPQSNPEPAPRPYDPLTRIVKITAPRLGGKRKEVLLIVAKATKAGKSVSSRDIIDATGFKIALILNVLTADRKHGYLIDTSGLEHTRLGRGYEYQMSEKGFEFLRLAGVDMEKL